MASLNKTKKPVKVYTHEGGRASNIGIEEKFKRTLFSCLLWEDNFYEDGVSIVDRLISYVERLPVETIIKYVIEARRRFNLRHVPLLILSAIFITGKYKESKTALKNIISEVISRPDEITELIKIYWELNNRKTLPMQMKKGIAKAFTKFDEYQLAKYKQIGKEITLRDAMFLTHPKPLNKEMEKWFRELADNNLPTPYTWETELSSGKDKKQAWTELLESGKLGSMALIRNIRNMLQAGVNQNLIVNALTNANYSKIFPYRFISTYTALKDSELAISKQIINALEKAMFKSLEKYSKLNGTTILLIDVSGSMDNSMSNYSKAKRYDVASSLGILIDKVCDNSYLFGFNNELYTFMNRGFALYEEIIKEVGGGTFLTDAITDINSKIKEYDRFIIITDEQSHNGIGFSKAKRNYIINVASYENGVGYEKGWVHINGFSNAILDFIIEYEKEYE